MLLLHLFTRSHWRVSGATIYDLPVELLLRIFKLHLVRLQHFSNRPPLWAYLAVHLESHGYRRGLYTLLAVSRQWRMLVEGTPELWGYVESEDELEVWMAALQKSKDTPLDLALWKQIGGRQSLTLEAVTQHSDRWRIVHIWSTRTYDLSILEQKPAPAIQSFHFYREAPYPLEPLTLDLFRGYAPHLTSLHLWNTALKSWTSPILIGLRSLTIADIPEE